MFSLINGWPKIFFIVFDGKMLDGSKRGTVASATLYDTLRLCCYKAYGMIRSLPVHTVCGDL